MKQIKYLKKLAVLVLILVCNFAFAHKVIGISDGDTMTLLVEGKPLKIRLANIDAPEKKQAFGQKSKESLSDICWGTDATYEAQTVDRYGRTVAVVFCNGVEANTEQVRKGMAWNYKKYNKNPSLDRLESEAREQKIGLWQDDRAINPEEFRKCKTIPRKLICDTSQKITQKLYNADVTHHH